MRGARVGVETCGVGTVGEERRGGGALFFPYLAVTYIIVVLSIGLQRELTNRLIIMPLAGGLPTCFIR